MYILLRRSIFAMYSKILLILLITNNSLLASSDSNIQRRQVNSNLVSIDYPRFLIEPKSGRHYFSNSTGLILNCQSTSSNVYWILASDLIKFTSNSANNQDLKQLRLNSINGLRHLLSNGSMHFPPFTASALNPSIHLNSYKCVTSNSAGTIVSRTVHVSAVIDQHFDASVYDEFAISGNTAVLKCQVPSAIKQFIRTEAWIRDSNLEITSTNDKYSFFQTGELHVKEINTADSFSKFRCRIRNILTNETKISSNAASIVISNPTSNIAPRVLHSLTSLEINEQDNKFIELPCAAEGYPLPSYRWYKLTGLEDNAITSSLNGVINLNKRQLLGIYSVNQTNNKLNNQAEIGNSGSLILRNLRSTDNAHYICIAFNSLGEFTIDTELKIRRNLNTSLRPKRLISDKRSKIVINCTINGFPIDSVHWLHNGLPISVLDEKVRIMLLGDQSVLMLDELKENSIGMYQCIAENSEDSAQDSIELLLGEIKPAFNEKFPIEMRAQIGDEISLKCIASGSPLPMITWYLDGELIVEERNDAYSFKSDSHSYPNEIRDISTIRKSSILWGDYVLFGKNQVVSHLNFTVQSVLNAGSYSCVAKNLHGSIVHQGRLEVSGQTRIKPMRSRSVVAQQLSTILDCDVVGDKPTNFNFYWIKDNLKVPFNHRQRIHKNVSLEILNIDKNTDSGNYTCVITYTTKTGHVQTISESMFLTVKVSPVIEDFKFDNKLQAGMRTRIYCNVAQGDLPLSIKWFKDNIPIEKSNEIASVRSIDQFSVALVIENLSALHNGNYTCMVSNDASVVSHTAELLVNIPPNWKVEPNSTYSAIEGSSIIFDCSATGFPATQVVWKQLKNKIGPTVAGYQQNSILNKIFMLDNSVSAFVDSNVISGNSFQQGQMTQQYHLIRSGPHYQVYENGSLRISEVNGLLDQTNYLCQASNGIGSGLSKMVTLKVNVPAKFEQQNKLVNISALKGQSLSLKCQAFGDLPITFQWFKQGEQIRPNERPLDERYQIEQIKDSATNHLTSFLNISSLTRSDSVRFDCRAKNQFGSDVRFIDLIVKEAPEPPINIQLESSSSRSLFIKWASPIFNGNSPIVQYNIQVIEIGKIQEIAANFDNKANNEQQSAISNNQDSNRFLTMINQLISTTTSNKNAKSSSNLDPSLTDTHNHFSSLDSIDYHSNNNDNNNKVMNFTVLANTNNYVIRGLNPATNYSIQMQSVNIIGKSENSLPLYASTEEEQPSEAPKNVQINVLNATAALVTWNPPELNSLNGILKGFYIGYKQKNSTTHYTYKTLQIGKQQQTTDEQLALPNSLSSIISKNQHQLVLNYLKPYTVYTVVIQAYNKIGAGPRSNEIEFKTEQSNPIAAPTITKCTSPNSRTLHLSWTKIPEDKLNGELTGYKIHYYTFDEQQTNKPLGDQLIIDGNQNLINNIFQAPNEIEIQNLKYDQLINLSTINTIRRTEHIPPDQNETQISNLNKFQNYTISIQGVTTGDGPLSEFIFCSTAEDIPDPPSAIKVVQTSIDSFYITWIPPKKTNGGLKSYTIYRKQVDQNQDDEEKDELNENSKTNKLITSHSNLYTFTVPKHVNYHRTSQLNQGLFEFFVTATNDMGESEPSNKIRRKLNKNGCAAEIINFNTIYNVYVGDSLEIPCKASGCEPKVSIEWLLNGQSLRSQSKTNSIHEHYSPNEQIFSSFLHLTNIQLNDQANYTCHAFNIHGHSYVNYQIQVYDLDTIEQLEYDDPDENNDANRALNEQNQLKNSHINSTFSKITSPLIRLIKTNYDHIIIQWKVRNPFLLNSILAYDIFYRPISSLNSEANNLVDSNIEWKQFRLKNSLLDEQQQTSQNVNLINKQQLKTKLKRNRQITINGLNCGTNYQIYMILDTVFGKSTPSNVLNTRTLGREPIAANLNAFFSKLNSTTVKLNLDKWNDNGCPVFEYKIKWKQILINRNNTQQISKKSTGYNLLNGQAQQQQTPKLNNEQQLLSGQWNTLNNIWNSQQPVFLTNLDQNNHYKVRVDMRNSAGLTSMDYDLRVNAVPLIKPQSENTFRVLSSSSSSYSNHDLDVNNQEPNNKNNDLIRSSTIGINGEDNQQITSQLIFLTMFIILLFVIVIAVVVSCHRTMQQKLFYARSNRILQLDGNSILSGPTSAINSSDSVSNTCKQHFNSLNKLHQLNLDYSNATNLTAELSVLRSNGNQQQCLDPTYAKCLLKHQQQPNVNLINNNQQQQHTTSLHNIETDSNVYQSLTLARTNTDNLLSTFSKKVNANPQEIYSVIQKNRQQDQHKTLHKYNTTYTKQSLDLVDELEQQSRYSVPKICNQQDVQFQQQRLFESNYITNDQVDLHAINNLDNLPNDATATMIKHNLNSVKSLPKMFANGNTNNFDISTTNHNDCNCCNLNLDNDCCTMNQINTMNAINQLNTLNQWRNNCDF